MYRLFLLLLFVISSVVTESAYLNAQSESNNPIMIIRCRFDGEDEFTDSSSSNKGDVSKDVFVTSCPFGYTLFDIGCYPDCNLLADLLDLPPAPSGYYYAYNEQNGMCECEFNEGPSFTGKESNSKAEEACEEFPFESCFEGEVVVQIPEIDCENLNENGLVFVEVCFTSADPNNPLLPGQQVPFEDIQNCLDENGLEYIDQLATPGEGESFYFNSVVGEDGLLCTSFYIDPSQPVVINFTNSEIVTTVPTCFEDPCACENPNIRDTDGNVVRFYDELTNSSPLTPGHTVFLNSNNNFNGFTDADGNPILGGITLGVVDGNGDFKFVYYRDSGELANVDLLVFDGSGSQVGNFNFTSDFACDANDCAVIPTISQWGLLILGLLLSSLACVFMLLRSRVTA